MTLTEAFPDYPVSDLPAMPEGFELYCWVNDLCPAFVDARESAESSTGRIIYVNYADAQLREHPDSYRFNLIDSTNEITVDSDNWADILAALANPHKHTKIAYPRII